MDIVQEIDGGFAIMDMSQDIKDKKQKRLDDNVSVLLPYIERVKLYDEEAANNFSSRLLALSPIVDNSWIIKMQELSDEIYSRFGEDEVISGMQ